MLGRHGQQLSLAYKDILDDMKESKKNSKDKGDFDEDEMDEDSDDEEETEGVIRTDSQTATYLAARKAGAPAGGTFAVIRLARSNQFKVTVDDVIIVNKLKPVTYWKVGRKVVIDPDDVLLVGDQERTFVGLPGLNGAKVEVRVEEITRGKTVVVFKKRRRKHSKRKHGFRREVTFLRILDIRMPSEIGEEASKAPLAA